MLLILNKQISVQFSVSRIRMKKRKAVGGAGSGSNINNNSRKTKDKKEDVVLDDDDNDNFNQGFSEWLRTSEGVSYMRVFVVLNSFVVFLTMLWPNLTSMFNAIGSYFEE